MGKGVINLSLWDLLKGYGRIPKAGEPLMSSNCCGLHLSIDICCIRVRSSFEGMRDIRFRESWSAVKAFRIFRDHKDF